MNRESNRLQQGRWVRGGVLALAMAAAAPSHGFLRPVTPAPVETAAAEVEAAEPLPAERAAPSPHGAFRDLSNPDLSRLQVPTEALTGLPRDPDGKVDWVRALREGTITPRGSVDGTRADAPLELDVIMKNTREMPWVRFPHRTHTEWLDCSNCHPAIFEARAGSARIRMEDIFRGRFCGTCHDRVAFITHRNCFRCHSVPREPEAARK